MTISDPWHNEYECPVDECGEWVSVPLPLAKYVTCPACNTKLEIHPDADFEDGHWHDRTALSIVPDPEREHMKRMLAHAKKYEHPLQEECDHKYFENENAPLGVTCIRCGHFVGAWENERAFDGEDAEEWQQRSEEQGPE